jgi:hypothetical protein
MRVAICILCGFLLALSAMTAGAASPDDPGAPAPPVQYRAVISGTKTFRPVEPLPWADVNRRVAPPDARGPALPQGKQRVPTQPDPQHQH